MNMDSQAQLSVVEFMSGRTTGEFASRIKISDRNYIRFGSEKVEAAKRTLEAKFNGTLLASGLPSNCLDCTAFARETNFRENVAAFDSETMECHAKAKCLKGGCNRGLEAYVTNFSELAARHEAKIDLRVSIKEVDDLSRPRVRFGDMDGPSHLTIYDRTNQISLHANPIQSRHGELQFESDSYALFRKMVERQARNAINFKEIKFEATQQAELEIKELLEMSAPQDLSHYGEPAW